MRFLKGGLSYTLLDSKSSIHLGVSFFILCVAIPLLVGSSTLPTQMFCALQCTWMFKETLWRSFTPFTGELNLVPAAAQADPHFEPQVRNGC